MAEAFTEISLENMSSKIGKKLRLYFGVDKEMKRISIILSTIRAVLEDAEEKQLSNRVGEKGGTIPLPSLKNMVSTMGLKVSSF